MIFCLKKATYFSFTTQNGSFCGDFEHEMQKNLKMLALLAHQLIYANKTHTNEIKEMQMFCPQANEMKRTKYGSSV